MRFRRGPRPTPFEDSSRKRAAFFRKQRLECETLPLFADHIAAQQHNVEDELAAKLLHQFEHPARREGAQTTEIPTVHKTAGTNLKWSNLREWLDAVHQIAGRAPCANTYEQERAHWDALPEVFLKTATTTALVRFRQLLDGKSNAWGKPPRGQRGGTKWEKLNVEVNNELQRRKQAAKTRSIDDRVKALKDKMIVIASGMSRAKDMAAGSFAWGGRKDRGIGVDVGELSTPAIDQLAKSVRPQGPPVRGQRGVQPVPQEPPGPAGSGQGGDGPLRREQAGPIPINGFRPGPRAVRSPARAHRYL
jgi:hypothetical protein